MLKCKVCGYKTSSTNLMHSHISSAHRSTVIRDSRLDRSDECTMFSSATLANFIVFESLSDNSESFAGGGGSSGDWSDNSDSGTDSSSCDSGSCGD